MVGKWHLGYQPDYLPTRRGFDSFFGFPGGAHSYFPNTNRDDPGNAILRGDQPTAEPEYLTDAFGDEAVKFVAAQSADKPFFLYLTFNAVHSPLQATDKYLARFAGIESEKRRTYAAMLSAMDDAVGRVLAAVRERGAEEKTLIFFVSDNGGPTPSTSANNLPLRATKGTTYEGGIRIPYLVQWKGTLPAGKVYSKPVITLDIVPTAVTAAGGEPAKNLDGVDLVPHLAGKTDADPHAALFWRFGPAKTAVRVGDYKLVRNDADDWELYNLASDVGELTNLATSQPEKAEELTKTFAAWNEQLAEPLWKVRKTGAGAAAGTPKAKKKKKAD